MRSRWAMDGRARRSTLFEGTLWTGHDFGLFFLSPPFARHDLHDPFTASSCTTIRRLDLSMLLLFLRFSLMTTCIPFLYLLHATPFCTSLSVFNGARGHCTRSSVLFAKIVVIVPTVVFLFLSE